MKKPTQTIEEAESGVVLPGFKIPAHVEQALLEEGKKDDRKKAAMARKVLKDWAEALGYSEN